MAVVQPDETDTGRLLEQEEEALRVYLDDKMFRSFADRQHVGHCDSSCACCCIEEDHFLIRMLAQWDEDIVDV